MEPEERGRPVRNAGYLAGANLGAKVFSFIAMLYTYRMLGKGLVGNYGNVLAYVGLFGVVTDLGLSTLAVRDVSQNPGLAVRYISNLLAVRVLLSLLTVGVILALLYAHIVSYIAPPLHSSVTIYALALVPLAISNTLQLVFQFRERLGYSAVLNVATSALTAALSIAVLTLGHHVLALVVVFTIVATANAAVMAWFVYARFLPRRLELDPSWWPVLLRAAAPFAVLTFLNVLYNYADRQILAALSGCGHKPVCVPVGVYTAAYRPLDILVAIFVGSINAATLPAFNRVVTESRAALARLTRSSSTLGLALGVPTALFVTFYAPEALHIVGGKSFIVGAPALSMLIWTFPCVLVLSMLYNALYAIHRQKVVAAAFGVTLVFNVVTNVLLIPHYSYFASAALTVASELVNGVIVYTVLRRGIGPLGIGPAVAKMAAIVGVTAALLWACHVVGLRIGVPGIFLGIPLGAVVVIIGLRVTRFLGPTEREILGRAPLFGRYAGLLLG